jgi:glycosyltransferase involved in cell wall biosynthesis
MKKKALIVTALAGFIRSFLTNDIRILKSMGYEVHCAANINHHGAEGMSEYFNEQEVIFHQVDFSSYRPLSKETLNAYFQFKKLIREEYFDLVHCHTPIVGVIARWACKGYRRQGQKVIYTTHGFYFHSGSSKNTWLVYRTIEDFMSKYADAIITINNEDYNNAKLMHCKNVYHINGVGVDVKKFCDIEVDRNSYRRSIGIDENDFVVLAVGELSERKNQKIVIEALGKLNIPNLVFVHCGNAMNSSDTTEKLKKLAKEKGVKMMLLGLRNDIPQICKCSDIGTISSTREGLGLAGIEMLASGLPVVASKVHGIMDYMQDGVNGYTASPYSSDEFAEGIKKLIDKDIRNNMSEMCKKSVDKFDCHVSFAQMSKIYREVLD